MEIKIYEENFHHNRESLIKRLLVVDEWKWKIKFKWCCRALRSLPIQALFFINKRWLFLWETSVIKFHVCLVSRDFVIQLKIMEMALSILKFPSFHENLLLAFHAAVHTKISLNRNAKLNKNLLKNFNVGKENYEFMAFLITFQQIFVLQPSSRVETMEMFCFHSPLSSPRSLRSW